MPEPEQNGGGGHGEFSTEIFILRKTLHSGSCVFAPAVAIDTILAGHGFGGGDVKIERIETFQVQLEEGTTCQRSTFVRIWTNDGLYGAREGSTMQGGTSSLLVIQHDIAPAWIGADPLDHAVLQDRLMQKLVELGSEWRLTGVPAASTSTLNTQELGGN